MHFMPCFAIFGNILHCSTLKQASTYLYQRGVHAHLVVITLTLKIKMELILSSLAKRPQKKDVSKSFVFL